MRVLVTGGSGFIAAHCLDSLLARGHSVVTTVRSQQKADKIKASFPNAGKDKLDFAIVEDISKEGAFKDAVVSDPPFDAVLHTASPFHFNAKDVKKDLLDPAVVGTTDILKQIQKSAPTVKRVVITSSFASIINPSKGAWPEKTYNESDWSPITYEQALETPQAGYRASKKFAEEAAWQFVEKEKPAFSIATLCPPSVFGPVNKHLQTLDSLNTSNERMRDMIAGKMQSKLSPTGTYIWIDVRDLADLHVLAMEKPEAANQRYFTTAGLFANTDIVEVIGREFPEYKKGLPEGEALKDGAYPEGGCYKADNRKATDLLGRKWRGLDESVRDTVNSLKEIGA